MLASILGDSERKMFKGSHADLPFRHMLVNLSEKSGCEKRLNSSEILESRLLSSRSFVLIWKP